jgi:hypothetical protein
VSMEGVNHTQPPESDVAAAQRLLSIFRTFPLRRTGSSE